MGRVFGKCGGEGVLLEDSRMWMKRVRVGVGERLRWKLWGEVRRNQEVPNPVRPGGWIAMFLLVGRFRGEVVKRRLKTRGSVWEPKARLRKSGRNTTTQIHRYKLSTTHYQLSKYIQNASQPTIVNSNMGR
jgi:hypothetical protein